MEAMARRSAISPRLSKVLNRVSGNIERLRQTRGWSQDEAAEKLGSDLRWYQRLESGKHVLSLDTIVRLGQVYKVDVVEFFLTED